MQDVFQLQDDLARQILESLSIPLTATDRIRLGRDVPASGRAYELYLRANHLAHGTTQPARLLAARELYRACLADDANYAPAWARLGRVDRVLAKFGGADAQDSMRQAKEAFERAFALNPDLPLTHNLFTPFEIEELGHAEAAMTRLLHRARQMPNDPDLFNGLVIACRYCGLLRASVAAATRVRQLDPAASTSVQFSYLFLNDEENAIRYDVEDSPYVKAIVELQSGRTEDALAYIAAIPRATPIHTLFVSAMEAIAQGRNDDAVEYSSRVYDAGFRDPEGLCLGAVVMTHAGAYDRALDTIEHVIDGGFMCAYLRTLPWMAPLVGNERFERLMARADEGRRRAATAFTDAGGDRLLGVVDP